MLVLEIDQSFVKTVEFFFAKRVIRKREEKENVIGNRW